MAGYSTGNRGAYTGGNRSTGSNSGGSNATLAAGAARQFKDDPNEVGIGYQKDMKSGGSYISFTVTKDIAAGTKVAVFNNDKVKNRSDKTPTHKMKLSVRKQA